jgi:hypothetical protein
VAFGILFFLFWHVVLSTGARGVGLLDFSCTHTFLVDDVGIAYWGCRERGDGAVGEGYPPLGRYAFNFRQKVQRCVLSSCGLLFAVCCLLFAVSVLAMANYRPFLVHEIPRQPTLEAQVFFSTLTPRLSIDYFSHLPATSHSTNSLLPLPPLNLPLPRRPEQLILHLRHLLLLHTGRDLPLLFLKHPSNPC